MVLKTGGKEDREIERNLRIEPVEHSDGSLVCNMTLLRSGNRNKFNAQP